MPWNDENGIPSIKCGHTNDGKMSSNQLNRLSHYSKLKLTCLFWGECQTKQFSSFLLLNVEWDQRCFRAQCRSVVSAHVCPAWADYRTGLNYYFLITSSSDGANWHPMVRQHKWHLCTHDTNFSNHIVRIVRDRYNKQDGELHLVYSTYLELWFQYN